MTLVRHYDAATAPRGPLRHLKSLIGYPGLVWRNRYMLQNSMRRDLLGRVHGSFLGVYWILLQPSFQFLLFYFVFGVLYRRSDIPAADFAVYLFSGVIVFLSLVEATTTCCTTIVDNGNLVKKVAFPSEVLPVHVALVSLVTYLVGAIVCLAVGLIAGVLHLSWAILALPLVLVIQFVMTLGLGLMLANLYVFVRDVGQVWRIVGQAWQFLTPVFWMPKQLEEALGPNGAWWVAELNPAYSLVMAHRIALGGSDPMLGDLWSNIGTAAAWATFFLVLGYSTFMASKHKYADLV
ncbi:MAG: ABC transporter permease [Planctomycetes bacterium]|jgi:ABC-type polysaccharide/polyol phosphate export permease|nr:ABC transporter permease [Planctomycetota bacterium]